MVSEIKITINPIAEIISFAAKLIISAGVIYGMLSFVQIEIEDDDNESGSVILEEDSVLIEYELTTEERNIATALVPLEDLDANDVAVDNDLMEQLQENIIYPFTHPTLFQASNLSSAPRGVLFHGPPGCGKTLLAKLVAKECGARFVNLDFSHIFSKYVGESEKQARAVFSLAEKIAPCIIFFDEIDSLLRSRSADDHDTTSMVKAQFLKHWDGLQTKPQNISPVMVIGATNRIQDIDHAILRRLPMKFHIKLPDLKMRSRIFQKILSKECVDESLDFKFLATVTDKFSGSDILEVCRKSSVRRVRELIKSDQASPILRPLNTDDITRAIEDFKKAKVENELKSFYQDMYC